MKALLPQQEVRVLLGSGCFVRRAASDDALFVSDAPRLFLPDARAIAEQRLVLAGFCVWQTERGLWAIDLDESRWLALVSSLACRVPVGLPSDARLHGVFALARLLWAHPCEWSRQPREPLRALLKCFDQPEKLIRLAPELLELCAGRLRKGIPLPAAGAKWLFDWLAESEEEGERS